MQFKDIIGQEKLKRQLIETVDNGRISHAQLFLGKGVNGKFALAVAYAQYINCPHKTADDSCGVCLSCKKYQALSHPDLFFSFPVNKGKKGGAEDDDGEERTKDSGISKTASTKDLISTMFNKEWLAYLNETGYYPYLQDWYSRISMDNQQGIINVEEARRIVKDLSFRPSEAHYKVLIIWHPDKMNPSAANLLLKFFEEPPARTLIIMVADEKELLLNTIQSRFQLIPVPKIDSGSLRRHLRSMFPAISTQQIENAVILADGDVHMALSVLMEGEQIKDHFLMFQSWMRMCYKAKSLEEIKDFVEKVSKIGRENQKEFLQYGLRLIHQSLNMNYGHATLTRLTIYEKDWLSKFSPFIHINNSLTIIEKLEKTIFEIGRNASAAIIFMKLSLDLSLLLKIPK
jgi:DNA polymerase-3 subunit delta'